MHFSEFFFSDYSVTSICTYNKLNKLVSMKKTMSKIWICVLIMNYGCQKIEVHIMRIFHCRFALVVGTEIVSSMYFWILKRICEMLAMLCRKKWFTITPTSPPHTHTHKKGNLKIGHWHSLCIEWKQLIQLWTPLLTGLYFISIFAKKMYLVQLYRTSGIVP